MKTFEESTKGNTSMSVVQKFTKGQTVKAYMGFTCEATYQRNTKNGHELFITDSQCGMGFYRFSDFVNDAFCTEAYPTPAPR